MDITIYTYTDDTTVWTTVSAIGTILSSVTALGLAFWGNKDPRNGITKISKYDFKETEQVNFNFFIFNSSQYVTFHIKDIDLDTGNKELHFQPLYTGENTPLSSNEYNVKFYNPYSNSDCINENFGSFDFLINEMKKNNRKYKSTPILKIQLSTGITKKIYPSKQAKKLWNSKVKAFLKNHKDISQ